MRGETAGAPMPAEKEEEGQEVLQLLQLRCPCRSWGTDPLWRRPVLEQVDTQEKAVDLWKTSVRAGSWQ